MAAGRKETKKAYSHIYQSDPNFQEAQSPSAWTTMEHVHSEPRQRIVSSTAEWTQRLQGLLVGEAGYRYSTRDGDTVFSGKVDEAVNGFGLNAPKPGQQYVDIAPLRLIMHWNENSDIGADTGTPISNDYQVPFRFTGKLNKLTLTIDRPKLTPGDVKKFMAAQRNNRTSE